MSKSFTHLHVHTEFSMLDGYSKLKGLVEAAAKDGQKALAITDHGNMYGAIPFYNACKEAGVKPIIGSELYQAQESINERPKMKRKTADDSGETGNEGGSKLYYHLTALAETQEGYHNLMKLSSETFTRENSFYYKPRCDWDMLSDYASGLIVTSGCLGGQVLQALIRDDYSVAKHTAGRFQDIFGKENFFIELQDHGIDLQKKTNPMLVKLSKEINAPLVLTNDSHYTNRHDHKNHSVLLCCQTKAKMSDEKRFKFDGTEHYVKTAAEMRSIFPDLEEASDNTLLIAERCNVELEMNVASLPHVEVPEEFEDTYEYLLDKSIEGCVRRYGSPMPGEVKERLLYEIDTVKNMGFLDYFLIVADLIDYSRSRGIRIGPGRGSAAGSILAFALGITDIDPLEYGLLFERFLNPARVSMPDIDMDFDTRYRDEMIQYCRDTYGSDHVANIITYSTIKSRSAIRDTARVLDYPFDIGNKIIEVLPPLISGFETPLAQCFKETATFERGYSDAVRLRELYKDGDLVSSTGQVLSNEQVREIIDVAKGLEGLRRQDGVHAAAVVISDKPLTEYLPVQRKPAKDGIQSPLVTQFDMGNVEDLGLLKMDFLGLRNLDIISDTIDMVKERTGEIINVDYGYLDLKDENTIALLNDARTLGVFQIESLVMRDTIKAMGVHSFDDIAALNALCRPGPMADGMHFDYGNRKNNRAELDIFHEDAVEYLSDTYNLMIYQEQLMSIANKFAGYSLGEAYLLLKACAKKKRDLMALERDKFVAGCEKRGYGEELGHVIFDIIEPFASYSFNKSHAVAYAFISFQTAYLKANHPVEYMCSLLSANGANPDKLRSYLNEARRMGLKVRPPHINKSMYDFYPISDDEISFGLEAVKGIGTSAAAGLIEERDRGGEFLDFFDFVDRMVDKTNSKVMESLIMSGAFKESRLGLKNIFEEHLKTVRKRKKKSAKGQESLFDSTEEFMNPEVEVIEIDVEALLELESEYLGLYVSSHPLHHIQLIPVGVLDISDVQEYDSTAHVGIMGVINNVDVKTTRKGERMAIVNFQDLSGSTDVVIFPRVFAESQDLIKKGAILRIAVKYAVDNSNRAQMIAEKIYELK